jgi:hypothetical protein
MKLVDRPRGKGLFNKTTTSLLFECNYETEATDTYIYKPQIESKKEKNCKREICSFLWLFNFTHAISIRSSLSHCISLRLTLNLIVATHKMKSSSCNQKKKGEGTKEKKKRRRKIVKHLNSDFIIDFDLF